MPKPYDAVSKRLIELRPSDWVAFLGLPPGAVSIEDADLSTITAFADRLIRVETPTFSYLVHNELESGKDTADLPLRLLHYNASVLLKRRLPVVSTVFLLHKGSNSPAITGAFEVPGADGVTYFSFRYNVVRVWQLDPDELLAGGLATLPLAPIANVRATDLPRIVRTMRARIDSEAASDAEAAELWTGTNVLMGLRYNTAFRTQLLKGVRRMRESNTYREILDEGRAEGRAEGREEGRAAGINEGARKGALHEARRLLLRLGVRRLGVPNAAVETRVETIDSLAALEALMDRILDVETWDDLLGDAV